MENGVKNREWVKNVAIIFLAVLLVLTFFSNTIMNRTLPQVKTAQIMSSTINAKVKGTGTVSSLGTYEVKATETREIRSVMVKNGAQVNAGDVLFVLGSGSSEEVEQATETLRQLRMQLSQAAVNAPNYGAQLQKAETDSSAASINEQICAAVVDRDTTRLNSTEIPGITEKQIADATEQIKSAEQYKKDADEANIKKTDAERTYVMSASAALQAVTNAANALDEFVTACNDKGINNTFALNDAVYAMQNAKTIVGTADGTENAAKDATRNIISAGTTLYQFYSGQKVDISSNPELGSALENARVLIQQAFNYLCDEDIRNANNLVFTDVAAGNWLKDGQTATITGKDLYSAAMEQADKREASETAQRVYDNYAGALNTAYENAKADSSAAESKHDSLLAGQDDANRQAALAGISMSDLNYQIKKAQAKLDELTGGSENQITANVSGTVTAVNVTAGSTAAKDDVLCTIDVPDMGYSLSYSVSTDQAKRLHPGVEADVVSYYWGSKIEATLTSIKPDPRNPQSSRLLEFEIRGDVTPGSQLTVTVGENGSMYDSVVPTSAIRTDANGTFVLLMQEKSSPLGNRYYAKRVAVEIQDSDDTNSAISGTYNYYDQVITTSSAPIKPGDQVRLSDDSQ